MTKSKDIFSALTRQLDAVHDEEPSTESELKLQDASFDSKQKKWELKRYKQNYKLRREFAKYIRYIVFGWILFIGLILVWAGNKIGDFYLSDSVLIALISGTSVNIIGLMWVVAKNLFPNSDNSQNKKS